MKFLKKNGVYGILLTIVLIVANTFVLVRTYIIAEVIQIVEKPKSVVSQTNVATENKVISDNEYKDDNIAIFLQTIREYNTMIYVADVKISNAEYLKTALAKDIFGTNITEKTSAMAIKNNAILAVNGDYYGQIVMVM